MNAQQLRLALELALARHALPLLIGSLLLGGIVWCAAVVLPAQARERDQLQAQLTQTAAPAAPAPQDPMAAFRAVLRADAEKSEVARALWRAAADAGLQTSRVDYRSGAATAAGFSRFELTLPVSGQPAVIRRFAFSLLEQYPGLALEKIELQRESAAQDQVEAQLAFVLLLEAAE